ncbi:glycerophosphodiester phosphodiesterase [Sutcliffiella halmapala]|uniref:glycerophosphodiester phosphodiesterase n=1 Tax=Sutcliffiella halmapala TaxID=79882 RepID=UPI000994E0CB|nr:glycerophosphodiester phosphodiesterase [Sutcliffiella halmapala]
MAEIKVPLKKKSRWGGKVLLVFGGLVSILISLCLVFTFSPISRLDKKPFYENDRPLVIAHQGGELLAPSNTMVAFKQAAEMGVDVIETDIHITKDGHLVAIHDATVDRTTDGTGAVADLTLEEIQALDAGFHFQDLERNFSYRGQGVYIPTVEEIFQEFGNMRIEIEIKDSNPPEQYEEMAQKLWELTKQYKMEDKLLVAAFDQEIIRTFDRYANDRVAIAGGRQEIKKYMILHKLFVRNLYYPEVDSFQIPLKESIFDLTNKRFIQDAQRRGIQIHYWTIDDKETMRTLIEKGADGIITNRPDLMMELLEEMGY